MLIASRFQRPNAPVELPNKDGTISRYFFRPIDPASPASEHVAEVADPAHIQRLLGIPEGYYISEHATAIADAAAAAASTTERPVAPPPADPAGTVDGEQTDTQSDSTEATSETSAAASDAGTTPADANAGTAASDHKGDAVVDDVKIAASNLLSQHPREIKAALANTPAEVRRAALEIEHAKGEDERVTVTKALRESLGG